MSKDVLFVSWCPLKLLRPRALQVGRAGKALCQHSWRPTLICADFENYSYLFDREIESWYKPMFSKVVGLPDPEFQLVPEEAPKEKQGFQSWLHSRFGAAEQVENWTGAATREIERWVKGRERPIILSFAQPWTSHLAVLAVGQKFPHLRWAAHFSDPWIDSPYREDEDQAAMETARAKERAIIDRADAVVFVTEETAELVMRKYPPSWRDKVRVIPHMLDLGLPPIPNVKRRDSDRLRFVHSGSLYEGARAPEGLFKALAEMQRTAPQSKLPLTFHFVGWTGASTIKHVAGLSLSDYVTWTSPLYYTPSLRELAEADVLMVVDADFDVSPFLPSKIFDYMLFDKPMLALTPPGSATGRFLQRLGYPCVGPNDVEGIKQVLMAMIEAWKAGGLKPTAAHIEARKTYDVQAAGMRYVELVEELSA